LSYASGVDCPTPEALERELDARLGTGWQAPPNEIVRAMTITEEADGASHSVRVDYEDGQHRQVSRRVSASTCEEALSMTAVVVAVAIDALTRERESPNVAAAPAAAAAAPAAASPTAASPTAALPAAATPAAPGRPPAVPATSTPASEVPPESVPEPTAERTVFVHEAGLRFGVSAGFGTGPAYGAGLEWGMVERSGFAIRAALEGRTTGSVPAADARARFRAATARGEACFFAPTLTRSLSVPLCAGLEAGVFWAEGVVAPPAVTASEPSFVPWVAGLVTPRLRLATPSAYVELVPELRIPFVGHTFTFEAPERLVYEVPHLAFGGSIGAGLRFH
jgi:hypothetical protein